MFTTQYDRCLCVDPLFYSFFMFFELAVRKWVAIVFVAQMELIYFKMKGFHAKVQLLCVCVHAVSIVNLLTMS